MTSEINSTHNALLFLIIFQSDLCLADLFTLFLKYWHFEPQNAVRSMQCYNVLGEGNLSAKSQQLDKRLPPKSCLKISFPAKYVYAWGKLFFGVYP